MKGFHDAELIKVLENWSSYHRDSVKAALILLEQRGIEVEQFKKEIDLSSTDTPSSDKFQILHLLIWVLVANQIVGGFFGLTFINYSAPLQLLLGFPFFLFSMVCGILLIKRALVAILMSGLNFLLQLFFFQLNAGFKFKYYTGIHLGIEFKASLFALFAEAGAAALFGSLSPEPGTLVGINLMSILAFGVLYRYWQLKQQLKVDV
ncbi:MAG: hypothetical protein ACFB10_05955 [Salibacteraceae bacterium]